MEGADPEYGSQADFIKDEFNFGVDEKDPYTKALLNEEPKEDEWMDILGNGQLRKRTTVKGQKGTRPNQVAEIEIAARFGYGDVGRQPEIPPGAKLFYNVELKHVNMEPDIDSLSITQRKAIG
ncbi:hypothetical protein G9C98_001958 [Cotesia typhae]|uniref:peptidylprolyl isomerase n=1 Tax=Cotesia typhae TaxID=2053667 RepID=A0A8J5QSA1_9HYME|nr:hypothetical protein G9C98_001958 [Cotesia typhae]